MMFNLLDKKIQQWCYDQGWTTLRDAQERAISPILSGKTDVIIASATASGKTEAAFLPILSRLLSVEYQTACVIYVSPLKALINDQFSRMENLCEKLNISVHPWHGDISASKKKKFFKDPTGILLITPESLEALLIKHGHSIPKLFCNLLYIVVDELHAFIGSERGSQLQSLLHRIEKSLKRVVPRIGLSATIGDMELAVKFLRPNGDMETEMIISKTDCKELKLLLKGYTNNSPSVDDKGILQTTQPDSGAERMCKDLFDSLKGSSNLVFANSKRNVEYFSDNLRLMCEKHRYPNEFFPHHGNLAKDLREDAESAIKDKFRPVSIVCTSTLEMGIDIGPITSIAQIGPPPSVSSLRQRLGRSGRREGDPSILRIYLEEEGLSLRSNLIDILRPDLIQTISMIRLLLSDWYEPPYSNTLHLSTLIQQILSLISQYAGVTASKAYSMLCENGPFANVNLEMIENLLRCLGKHDLIIQTLDGLLLLGKNGERIVNHYSFYASFSTPVEYRLVHKGRTIGTVLAKNQILHVDSFIVFAGKRWIILHVDSSRKVIDLSPAKSGYSLSFGGDIGWIHDRVRQEMYQVYHETNIPKYLDQQACDLLQEAQESFTRLELSNKRMVSYNGRTYILFWVGDRTLNTLRAMLKSKGINVNQDGYGVSVDDSDCDKLLSCMHDLLRSGIPDVYQLAKSIPYEEKIRNKYDRFLTDELLSADYATSHLDTKGAYNALKETLQILG